VTGGVFKRGEGGCRRKKIGFSLLIEKSPRRGVGRGRKGLKKKNPQTGGEATKNRRSFQSLREPGLRRRRRRPTIEKKEEKDAWG